MEWGGMMRWRDVVVRLRGSPQQVCIRPKPPQWQHQYGWLYLFVLQRVTIPLDKERAALRGAADPWHSPHAAVVGRGSTAGGGGGGRCS